MHGDRAPLIVVMRHDDRCFFVVMPNSKFPQDSHDLPTVPYLYVPTTPTLFLRRGNFVATLWESAFRNRAPPRGDVFVQLLAPHFDFVRRNGPMSFSVDQP